MKSSTDEPDPWDCGSPHSPRLRGPAALLKMQDSTGSTMSAPAAAAAAQLEPLCSPKKLSHQSSLSEPGSRGAMLHRTGYVEEDKHFVPGVNVRAASIEKLAMLAVECFSVDGEIVEHKELPRVLWLMHQWFVQSDELAEKFLDLYKNCDSQVACNVLLCRHRLGCDDCARRQHKAKICHAVRYWIDNFPVHFDLNRRLSLTLHKLQELIHREDPKSSLAQLVDISQVPSYDWMRNMSVRHPSNRHSTKKVTLVFNNLKPDELAEQLTFLEFKAFRRITFSDFKHYAVHASLKDNPKLERSIALFNGLSQWIQCMVLRKTTPRERAEIIVKFVNVAKRLRQLQNFNTLMAVVGGLTHSSLARLSKTNACLPSDTQKMLMEYTELLSSSNNFSNYRKVLNACTGFIIPILGVHLKDLILLHTALPDRIDSNLINFRKMAQLSNIFTHLMQVQNAVLPFEANIDLVNTIRLALDLHYTEDEIYELSLAREPRNSLSAPSTPTKPVVFADWVAGISPPDPDTINKHVHDMVEAVFKNYDHDKDGFISHEEFDAIAGNFPFIDSFCVLDADKDGMISKTEMKSYFIRANCHAMRKCFKHDFHETTYFKPTFCIHCTGLLWGLIKQGWKCKDCGINAHKHCKDLVVMECRSKPSTGISHGRSNSVSNGAPRDVTLQSKRRMSQRQRRSRVSRATQTDDTSFGPPSSSTNSTSTNSASTSSSSASSKNLDSSSSTASMVSSKRSSLRHKITVEKSKSLDNSGSLSSSGSSGPKLEPRMSADTMRDSDYNSDHEFLPFPKIKIPPPEKDIDMVNKDEEDMDVTSSAGVDGTPSREDSKEESEAAGVSLSPASSNADAEFYEENSALYNQLEKSEEVISPTKSRDKLEAENQLLRTRLDVQNEQITTLKSHIGLIRQHTITFILDQMDTLHLQRDTEV